MIIGPINVLAEPFTTEILRREARNERHISRNQRGHTADLMDWAADEIDALRKQARSQPRIKK